MHLEFLYLNKIPAVTLTELTCGYTECFLALWKNGEIIAKILSRGHEITAFFATRKTKWPVNHPPPNIPYIRFIFRSVLDYLVYRAIKCCRFLSSVFGLFALTLYNNERLKRRLGIIIHLWEEERDIRLLMYHSQCVGNKKGA